MHLERQLLPAPVTGVQLAVLRSARQSAQQQVLCEPEPSLDSSWQLAGLVDRLSGRLGAERVVRCQLQSEAQPELAWREESLVARPPGRAKKRGMAASPVPLDVTDRPLHVLEKPERLQVMAVAPDGPPVRFHTTGHEHQVARHWGPERITTGWWRTEGIHRDYYRVETTEGRRFWLFRHDRSGKWFLHGVFD
jgi:protein ImuB